MARRRGDRSVFKQLNEQKIMDIQSMLARPGFTDAEKKMLKKQLKELKAKPFEEGGDVMSEKKGEVPSKFKGFSKLPEPVQQKMNPSLAKKYERGGEVKGHSRGGGAAIAGTKFVGVR